MLPLTTPKNFDVQAARARAYLSRPVRLKEIVLPAGDVQGFAIGVEGSTGLTKLNPLEFAGFDGVRIVGQGIDRTHMRQGWYGWTVAVDRFPGIVELAEMTVHTSSTWGAAISFGQQNTAKVIEPKFQLRMKSTKVLVDPPAPGAGRGKWGGPFGYQYDEWLSHCILDATQAREHDRYGHGAASRGSLWENVEVWGSGSQGFKERPDNTETAWCGRDKWIILIDCTMQNCGQDWTDRGGAMFVLENSSANVKLERCKFFGGTPTATLPANARSHAIMISAEANGYDILTGKVGTGFGNGLVKIKDCAAVGFSEFPWNNELISIYSNVPGMQAARGVLIEGCGLWGAGMQVKLDHIPKGQTIVTGCNTEKLREACARFGMNVGAEAVINTSVRQIPVSEGFTA